MIVDPTQIQLTPDQQTELAALSATTGKPWPIVFQEALTTYRQEESAKPDDQAPGESFFAAAQRLGLMGCLHGGPSDLSSNSIHMEGFGLSDG